MAEAQAAPATSTPAAEPSFAEAGIGSIFDALDAVEGEAANDTEPAPPPEGEPEATPENDNAEPEKAQAKSPDDQIFSDEALATPEGIEAARNRVTELRKMAHSKYLELKKFDARVVKRHERLNATINQFKAEKQNYDLTLNNVRSNLQGLHSGDPDTILTALGNLTGQDGLKALEQLNSRLIHKGKPQLDPQVQALLDQQQQQIEELRQTREAERAQAHVQHLNQQIDGHAQVIANQITSDQSLPNLNRFLAKDPNGTIRYLIDEITEVDGRVSPQALYRRIEEQLSGAPQGDGGTSATPKKAGSAVQRSPGQSIGPRTAAASNSREPTQDEIDRALANDLASYGL